MGNGKAKESVVRRRDLHYAVIKQASFNNYVVASMSNIKLNNSSAKFGDKLCLFGEKNSTGETKKPAHSKSNWLMRSKANFIKANTQLSVQFSHKFKAFYNLTEVLCQKKKASGMISSPSGSPKTLVFWRQISSPNSKGSPPNGGLKEGWGKKIQRFSSFKRQYLTTVHTCNSNTKLTY